MTATCATARRKANSGGDRSVLISGPIGPCFDRLRTVFRALWPAKTSLSFAWETGVSEKTADRYLDGRRQVSSKVLVALLRGSHGGAIYDAIMDGCTEQHWRDYQRGRTVGAAARKAREAQREIEAAIKQAAD